MPKPTPKKRSSPVRSTSPKPSTPALERFDALRAIDHLTQALANFDRTRDRGDIILLKTVMRALEAGLR